jgi:membrane-associated phospholipid phosphatase
LPTLPPHVLLRLRQVAWAVVVTALFALVYNGCLELTSLRHDVGRLYFDWELSRIPLVPAMAVPYWSLNLLFVGAFFVCRDGRELRTLSVRLAAATVVAGFCYVLVPLESGFRRPPIQGPFAPLFALLDATDLPYNLAPSLHVTMAVILGATYVSRSRVALRPVVAAWFVLIAASTLFTWQHHIIDVASGGVLGVACLCVGPVTVAAVNPTHVRRHAAGDGSFPSSGSAAVRKGPRCHSYVDATRPAPRAVSRGLAAAALPNRS